MPERLPFVDAHVHLWDLSHIHYPWLAPPFPDDTPNGSVEPIADFAQAEFLAMFAGNANRIYRLGLEI